MRGEGVADGADALGEGGGPVGFGGCLGFRRGGGLRRGFLLAFAGLPGGELDFGFDLIGFRERLLRLGQLVPDHPPKGVLELGSQPADFSGGFFGSPLVIQSDQLFENLFIAQRHRPSLLDGSGCETQSARTDP